jgi:hypothetical protein
MNAISDNSRRAPRASSATVTTVRNAHPSTSSRRQIGGKLHWAVLVCLAIAAPVAGQDGPVHWRHEGAMPPGAIGRYRLMRGGPLSGYCQPVAIRAPLGARIAAATEGGFSTPQFDQLLVGLQIGPVYRFHVTDIQGFPGVEVFPTVEMIDRTYPPQGQELKFPVPVDLTREEILMAAEGKFVTRVIYIEDPKLAIPIAEKTPSETRWIEAAPGADPLVTADSLGRPIAILRLGGRVPTANQTDESFLYCSPPVMIYDAPPQAAASDGVELAPHEVPIETLP